MWVFGSVKRLMYDFFSKLHPNLAPNSMAPEISLKQPYNLKADVYSFTILLYEVLTLEKVFHNWQAREIYGKVHRKAVRPRIYLSWSKRLKEFFRSCWSDNPDDRRTMKKVVDVLLEEVRDLQASMEPS